MSDPRDEPASEPTRDTPPTAPLPYRGGNAWTRPPTRLRGAVIAGVFSTLILAAAVVVGGISTFEQPEKRWMIFRSWGIALVFVLIIIGLARWRGTPGVVPGALVGIALTALFAGLCYQAS